MQDTLDAFREYLGFNIVDEKKMQAMSAGHTSKVCRTLGERIVYGQIAIQLHNEFSGELCVAFDATSDRNDEFQAVGVTKKLDNVCSVINVPTMLIINNHTTNKLRKVRYVRLEKCLFLFIV